MSSGAEKRGKAVEPAGSGEASSFGKPAAGEVQPEITGVYVRPPTAPGQEIQGVAPTRRRRHTPAHPIPSPRRSPAIEDISPPEQPQQIETTTDSTPEVLPSEVAREEPRKRFVLFAGPHGKTDGELLKSVGKTIKKMARKAPPEKKVLLWVEAAGLSVEESVVITEAVARNIPPSVAVTDEIVKTREQMLEAIRANLTEDEIRAEESRINLYKKLAPPSITYGFWGPLTRELDTFVEKNPDRLELLTEWQSEQIKDLWQERLDSFEAYRERLMQGPDTVEEKEEREYQKMILDAAYHRARESNGAAYIARHMQRENIDAGAAVIGYFHDLGFAEQLEKNGVSTEIVYLGNKKKPYRLGPSYTLMRELVDNPDAPITSQDLAEAYKEERRVKHDIVQLYLQSDPRGIELYSARRRSKTLAQIEKIAYESWVQKRQGSA